jgi:hypothetical protein
MEFSGSAAMKPFRPQNGSGSENGNWKGGNVSLICALCAKPFSVKPCQATPVTETHQE